jgi:hypothetical protein
MRYRAQPLLALIGRPLRYPPNWRKFGFRFSMKAVVPSVISSPPAGPSSADWAHFIVGIKESHHTLAATFVSSMYEGALSPFIAESSADLKQAHSPSQKPFE